jgi:hypothetical protein
MNIQIQNKDLPLWKELVELSRVIDVTQGTVTAFTNSLLGSIFIPKMDSTFDFAVRYMGNLLDRSKKNKLDKNYPASSLYKKTYNQNTREARLLRHSFDPMSYLDQGDAPSYETMRSAIEWICSLYKIDDEAKYYKDPYLLYASFQDDENNTIDNYLDDVLFPNFYQAMKYKNTIKEIDKAIKEGKDYVMETFYPEKCVDFFASYLHKLNPNNFVYLHQTYFSNFNYLSQENLNYSIENDNDRINFFDYTIKTFGFKEVMKAYNLENGIQLTNGNVYTRVELSQYQNLSALLFLEEKYKLDEKLTQPKTMTQKIKL